jgi:hypothetical protein
VTTTATQYSPPTRLPSGDYYWTVTPLNAESKPGSPSPASHFTWSWPATSTELTVTDLDASSQVFDPQFSWTPIPGATSYQVEINSAGPGQNWTSGSKVCCNTDSVATSYSPPTLLPADTYYWRVRAKDPNGNFGNWVVAPDNNSPPATFTINYDTDGISNLTMLGVNPDGTTQDLVPGSTTDTPIVSWNPTPGAASYDVDVVPYDSVNQVCGWTAGVPAAWHIETAATSWTPLGSDFHGNNPFPNTGHPGVSTDNSTLTPGQEYCVKVRARRNVDGVNNIVYGAYQQIGGIGNNPAFTFSDYPTGNPCSAPCNAAINIGADDYELPLATGTTSLPLFSWKPISGDTGYFVIVATDDTFQNVIDEAYTKVPAYAPRTGTAVVNYHNTGTKYAWAVLPASGAGIGADPTEGSSYPQSFDMESTSPTPIIPADQSTITTQPTFEWSPTPSAFQYRLHVYKDGNEVAGSPFTTEGTSFTASNFPASPNLTWFVEALDRSGNVFSASATSQFKLTLAVPTGLRASNDAIPTLQWNPMPGAVAYDLDIITPANGNGEIQPSSMDTTAYTPTSLKGTGTFTWTVKAEYPTAGGNVTSGASAPQTFTRTIDAPVGLTTTHSGARQLIVGWTPKAGAKNYSVQFSTDPRFNTGVFDSTTTDNPTFAPLLSSIAPAYVEGGTSYWRVASNDIDGNQSRWSAAQTLVMPVQIHLSATGAPFKGKTTTVKVSAKTAANKGIAGVSVKDSNCGVKSKTVKTNASGTASFSVKTTKSGCQVKFAGTKTGLLGSSVMVYGY